MNASTIPFQLPNLRRLRGPQAAPPAVERCQVCASAIDGRHRHLLEIGTGGLLCSCRGCWLFFADPGVAAGRLRAVPDRVAFIADVRVTADQWNALQIPVALVFFRSSSTTGRVTAFYPSPAGATESELPLDVWSAIVDTNPGLGKVTPDVEVVLVRGTHEDRAWYIVPIDACYELIGRMRRQWQGFSGGDAVGGEIDRFFATLAEKSSRRIGAEGHRDH
jgi:hypothetical protein